MTRRIVGLGVSSRGRPASKTNGRPLDLFIVKSPEIVSIGRTQEPLVPPAEHLCPVFRRHRDHFRGIARRRNRWKTDVVLEAKPTAQITDHAHQNTGCRCYARPQRTQHHAHKNIDRCGEHHGDMPSKTALMPARAFAAQLALSSPVLSAYVLRQSSRKRAPSHLVFYNGVGLDDPL